MYQRATKQKCLISTKLFYRALVTRVMLARLLFYAIASNSKRGFDDGGNTNSAHKAWHVIQYTQQRLNRRRKALVPENKPKEVEFWCMPEGKFYGGAELLKKKSKIRQNCWTRKVELVINNQIQATILIGYPLVIL